jgi:hypothetical protein
MEKDLRNKSSLVSSLLSSQGEFVHLVWVELLLRLCNNIKDTPPTQVNANALARALEGYHVKKKKKKDMEGGV